MAADPLKTRSARRKAVYATVISAAQHQLQRSVRVWDLADVFDDEELDAEDGGVARVKLRRRVYERTDYRKSGWWQEIQDAELADHNSRAARRFRANFRVPYPFFKQLVALVRERDWFPTAERDALGRPCIPVELKVLACLQILARGNAFADVYHMSFISAQTAATTFHSFCRYFARELYDEHIYLPTGEYQDKVMEQYDKIGFPGAIGSTDVTHIPWGMCPNNQSRTYTGKEGFPTVAYQVTVDHTKRVLAVTPGFTGSTNDKAIIRFDTAVTRVRTDPIFTERAYKVFRSDGTPYEMKGCYLLVNNEYHKWTTLLSPSKYPIDRDDLAFSKRLESERKDVECFFGICKGRFRILKVPSGFHKQEYIDNVFFTCCIIHNMLHSFDGMGEMDVDPDWESSGDSGESEESGPSQALSSVGGKDSLTEEVEVEVESGFAQKRQALVTSFAYRKRVGDIV